MHVRRHAQPERVLQTFSSRQCERRKCICTPPLAGQDLARRGPHVGPSLLSHHAMTTRAGLRLLATGCRRRPVTNLHALGRCWTFAFSNKAIAGCMMARITSLVQLRSVRHLSGLWGPGCTQTPPVPASHQSQSKHSSFVAEPNRRALHALYSKQISCRQGSRASSLVRLASHSDRAAAAADARFGSGTVAHQMSGAMRKRY